MRQKVRRLYICMAGVFLAAGITAAVLLYGAIFSALPDRILSPDEKAVLLRTVEVTSAREPADAKTSDQNQTSGNQNEQISSCWQKEIASNQLTAAEFVRVSFTGTKYLLQGKNDEAFAADLAYAVYGSEADSGSQDGLADTKNAEKLTAELLTQSRVYIIEKTLRSINEAYAPSGSAVITDIAGTRIQSVQLKQSLQDEQGFGFGIRKVSGSISINGDQARTDFFIDGNLRPASLDISQDESGSQSFSMLWDTRREEPGTHSVKVLMRTSDGRARILTGGNIMVPSFITLVNDGVQKGWLMAKVADAWYQLDASDRNAYINFVSLSGDICVTLYDMYGNKIGTNDLPGTQTEVLRGRLQELPGQNVTDPFVDTYRNMFYARVQKGAANKAQADISYLMVQSKEVAVDAKKNYLAVTSDVGSVPTPVPTVSVPENVSADTVTCRDINANTVTYAMSDLSFLPINGKLASLSFSEPGNSKAVPIYPDFSSTVESYGYVSEKGITALLSSLSCVEGYAADVSIEKSSETGAFKEVSPKEAIAVTPSRNIIRIVITDFDRKKHNYTLYLLSGADNKGYDTKVLNTFPQSYRSGIWLLHNLQPKYKFIPYDTGISWTDVMANEDKADRSLANDNSNPNWVKDGSPVYDGSAWRAAKSEVVSYFIDPRNFLDPVHVFEFEQLSFDPSIHTLEGVKAMVKGSFLEASDPNFPSILLNAGKDAGISPYFLTSRILQEMGRNGDSLLSKGTLPGYKGFYNFFNIGSSPNPDVKNGALINGAKFAMWGSDSADKVITPEEQAILLPWTSPDLAIRGGALWIASSYIDVLQNTLYFQKFDVISNEDGLYAHQYAQNISMAYTEGARYHKAYVSQNMLSSAFRFIIPVYLDMPEQYGDLPKDLA